MNAEEAWRQRRAEVLAAAQKELDEENFRKLVEVQKERLRKKKSVWDTIFPFRITIERKSK